MIAALLITILAFGVFILTLDQMRELYIKIGNDIKSWFRSFKEIDFKKIDEEPVKPGDKAWEHIRTLLQLTMGLGSDKSVKAFAIISGILSAATMVVLSERISAKLLILTMTVALILPYSYLRLRLEKLRIKSSREGEILITEILNNYRINYFNMREAIEKSAINIEEAPSSKRLLFNLSKGLNRAGSDSEIRHFTDEFRLSLNTSWGNILSDSIYMSLTRGTKVDEAISDLSKTVLKARNIDEFSRRQNNETKLILKYLVPLCFVGLIFGSISFFGLSFKEFIYYQFKTEVGLTWFTISVITYVIGILANAFISRTKLDF